MDAKMAVAKTMMRLSVITIFLRISILAVIIFMPSTALPHASTESNLQIWKVGGKRWTNLEETKYSEWVTRNITEDFFIRYEIPVDCADVVYATRWIYARLAKLPAAATTVDGCLMGHWSKDWAHLPTSKKWYKDQRFRAALLFVLSHTSTKSLPSDTYPISISAESVRAGTVFFIAESHAGVVHDLVLDGSTAHPVQVFEATLPSRIQKINQKNFISSPPDSSFQSGLVKLRWPVPEGDRWQYLPMPEHPFYSEEQYAPTFNKGYVDYIDSVAKRVDPNIYDPYDRIYRLLDVFIRQLQDRIPIVLEGYRHCHQQGCPEGSRLWAVYSTPGRDEYIYVIIAHIKQVIKKHKLKQETVLKKIEGMNLEVAPHRFIPARQIFHNAAWISSNPEDSLDHRWGLNKCDMIERRIKDAQDAIAFINDTYGKTNPRTAERLISIRQTIVNDMIEEKNKSHCGQGALQK